jgi:hypothetical protein
MARADAAVVLERLTATDLIERGSVTILSMEAIQARAGERWPRKREDVWSYVERKLDEHLSFQDIRHRISETDFLVAITTEEGIAAQAISLKILEEVLIHFLGAAEKVDLKLRAVTGIEGLAVRSTPVDPSAVTSAREAPGQRLFERGVDPAEARRRNPISFVIATGEVVRVDFALEHVLSLQHKVTAALRIRPTVTMIESGKLVPSRAFDKLADEDIAFIDRATLQYAALFADSIGQSQPPLILPASFRTMAGRKGRSALIGAPGLGAERLKAGLCVELIDIGPGTPSGRLTEVVGLVSQVCRGVFGRLQPARDALAPVRGARLKGLTLDVGELGLSDPHLTALMKGIALQARGKSASLMALGLPSDAWLEIAHMAGFTHAGVRAPPPTQEDRRLDLIR